MIRKSLAVTKFFRKMARRISAVPTKPRKEPKAAQASGIFQASQRVEPARALKLLGIPAHCYN
jgi:hypothetical protein